MEINIRLATLEDKRAWDAFVFSHPEANPYQLFGWNEAIKRAYGHEYYNFIAEKNHVIKGVLPLCIFKIPFLPKRIISLPFCDIAGVLTQDEEVRHLLFEKMSSLICSSRPQGVQVRTCCNLHEESYYKEKEVSVKSDKVRMVLDLPSSSEELWNGYKSKLRSQIKKAKKNRLRFVWGNTNHINDFYHVFSRNMRDLGSPVHSKKWIREIINTLGTNIRMGLIYLKKEPIACGLILCTQKTISIFLASSLKEYNYLGPNMMLYWKMIEYACNTGRTNFDFGRSTPNEGTYRFKKQWGAMPQEINWCEIAPCSPDYIDHNDKRYIVEAIWKKIPVFVANTIGPHIRKYISL